MRLPSPRPKAISHSPSLFHLTRSFNMALGMMLSVRKSMGLLGSGGWEVRESWEREDFGWGGGARLA